MTKAKAAIIVAAWLGIAFFNYGAMLADLNALQRSLGGSYAFQTSEESCRDNIGEAAGLAVLGPFALPVSVFSTGLLQHGWTLRCEVGEGGR